MSLFREARLSAYNTLQRLLPTRVREWIGGSRLTEPLRRALLWRIVEAPVDFHGRRFRFAAPMKMIAAIRRNGGIENGLCRLILEQTKPGHIVLDIGANYGFVTLVMANAVGSAGQVHSFEADSKIHDGLLANVTRNELRDRCTVVHGFVGDVADGQARITIDSYVATAKLERVDFIKIDVDGPDLQVLEGARATLSRFHPVIAIEMTAAHDQIIALLRELGYDCTDMQGRDLDRAAWPANVLAAVGRRLQVPSPSAISLPK